MKLTRNHKIAGIAAAAIAGGLLTGTVYQTAFGDDSTSPATAATEWKEPLAPFKILGNGETAGTYRPDTPLSERPTYIAAQLEDGTNGYLKFSDIDDGFVIPPHVPGEPVNVTKELAAAELRRKDVMIQPNAKGEIWAPLYAEDGKTVLGKKLMNPEDAAENR